MLKGAEFKRKMLDLIEGIIKDGNQTDDDQSDQGKGIKKRSRHNQLMRYFDHWIP